MFRIKSNYFRWSLKVSVFSVYLLFFSVQLFFNLDISPKHFTNGQLQSEIITYKTVHAENFRKRVDKTPVKSNIRLNKRFQPSSIPCTVAVVAEVSVLYEEPLKIGSYSRSRYSFVFLYTHSLRGPPVVV